MEKLTALEQQSSVAEMEDKYLTFWTAEQLFGIPITHVVQIVVMQEIVSVPEFPYYMEGIINLRGDIIPVMDMRKRLDKEEAAYTDKTCIIVIHTGEKHVGMIVDNVDEVTEIPIDLVSPPPQMSGREESYLKGVARLKDRIALLLDLGRILCEEEMSLGGM